MVKYAVIFVLGLLVFQSAEAQSIKEISKIKRDTAIYFRKNSGALVNNKDSADYIVFILPPDPVNNNLYPVFEYYTNGKRKFSGTTHNQFYNLTLEGFCIDYFPNGHRKRITSWVNGKQVGDQTEYYPNGQVYAIKRPEQENNTVGFARKLLLIECHDSTGKVLAENGAGEWQRFDEDFKNIYEEGSINNNVEDGEWFMFIDNKKFSFGYKNGTITQPINYDFKDKVFLSVEDLNVKEAKIFNNYLMKSIRYPAADRENNVQGKVFVTFILEKDGSMSDLTVISAPSKTLALEVLRVLSTAPKSDPATIAGVPVRSKFTMPVNFTLSNDK